MSQNQTIFYATTRDLAPVLLSLEEQKGLQYTLIGLFNVNKPQIYLSYIDIPNFGQTLYPTAVANPSYLLSLKRTALRVRDVPQAAGGIRFAIDQLWNEDTIVLRPGGRYEGNVVLYGMIGTVSDSVASKDLYRFAANVFRGHFERVQEFLVGSEALALSKAGTRLTTSASSPPEFDLKV